MDLKQYFNHIAWLDQRIQNFFERHPYLSLKTSQPKPQKTYEKITIVRMIFGNTLLSSFLMLALYQVLMLHMDTEAEVTLNRHSSTLDRLCVTHFLDPSPLLGFRPILLEELGYRSINQPLC